MIDRIEYFDRIDQFDTVLVAGAGGGFDIYSGIPIILNLIEKGKKVIIGNFSFTSLCETSSKEVHPHCYRIQSNDQDLSGRNYFPEKYLASWLTSKGIECEVYGFERVGVKPLTEVYNYLIDKHAVEAVVLVDGGTDSLMFGDEEGLGTPQEDMCSIAAVWQSEIKQSILLSVGFGIDHYHGVSHYLFLENSSKLSRTGCFLGTFHMTSKMKESQAFIEAVEFANSRMPGMESIVANSIRNALLGNYGDFHFSTRTKGSELWLNVLMTIYWCFDLDLLIPNIGYMERIKNTTTIGEFNKQLTSYRDGIGELRKNKQIPI